MDKAADGCYGAGTKKAHRKVCEQYPMLKRDENPHQVFSDSKIRSNILPDQIFRGKFHGKLRNFAEICFIT